MLVNYQRSNISKLTSNISILLIALMYDRLSKIKFCYFGAKCVSINKYDQCFNGDLFTPTRKRDRSFVICSVITGYSHITQMIFRLKIFNNKIRNIKWYEYLGRPKREMDVC